MGVKGFPLASGVSSEKANFSWPPSEETFNRDVNFCRRQKLTYSVDPLAPQLRPSVSDNLILRY
ncbi:hypothetical protein GCWU000246_01574 [Jonquetella anthropi E3_33 E1]|nr:hypothetical protein GCWU000246_01574 [Jonquetella anthropi E3_33 E1]